ncbi:MAG: hypothetical protein JWQ62_273 [Lacunisphaera sp.]|nr:hypothetical protein [Lacunisphaera sp.]
MSVRRASLFLALLGLLLAGCVAGPSPFLPEAGTKYSVENTGKFAMLDPVPVACTGLQEHVAADGRLAVVANVQNHANAPQAVQVRCVFKNGEGFSTGDETAWQMLVLGAGATEAVRFTAVNNLARKYTVMVRLPR